MPYHRDMVAYLKTQETPLWNWFASSKSLESLAEQTRLELLKSTVRLDRDTHGALFAAGDVACAALGLELPVSFYQAQSVDEQTRNAALMYLPGEAHIVFWGPVLDMLDELELQALVGHELAHYELWSRDNRDFLIADRLLDSVCQQPGAEPAHILSQQRYRLYTECYADRGGLQVSGDRDATIRCLVKMTTGLSQVSASAYLQQAEEIFAADTASSNGTSHPEPFIRARALARWEEQAEQADAQLPKLLEGTLQPESLDLLGQQRLQQLTGLLMQAYFQPHWAQEEVVLAHARMLDPEFEPEPQEQDYVAAWQAVSEGCRDYGCYLLLDLIACGGDDELPLLQAQLIAEQLGWRKGLEEMARKELKLTKKRLDENWRDRDKLLNAATGASHD